MKGYMFILLLLLLGVNLACRSEQEVAPNNVDFTEFPDQEGAQATLTTTSNGRVSSKVMFGRMEGFSGKNLIKFSEGVEVDIFDDAGNHVSKVNCKRATLHETSDDLELLGNVQVRSDDGVYLQTEKLRWDKSEDKILTEEFVTVITAENDTIHGNGFESEKSLKNWIIKKPRGVSHKKLNLDQ